MKILILAIAVVCAQASPDVSQVDAAAQVLKYNSEFISPEEGHYKYEFETSNGIAVQEEGALKNQPNSEYPSLEVKGSFGYKSPEGETVQVTYISDGVNGFQPQGSHLPTPPPVPDYILRSLQYIEAHPPPPPRA